MSRIDSQSLLGYNPALDGLRGVAILMVMVFHATPHALIGGYIGVDIFFVLSGFLITTLLIREYDRQQSISLRNFYMRRLLRLGPALLLLLLVYSGVAWFMLDGEVREYFLVDAVITLFYAANWARALDLHPPDYLGHAWSLAIEEQFYLLWPFLFLAMARYLNKRSHWLWLTLALALCAWAWRWALLQDGATPMRLYNGSDTRADALMIGCALALLLSMDRVRRYLGARSRGWLAPLGLAAVLCLGFIAGTAHWDDPEMFKWGYLLVALSSAILITDLMRPGAPGLLRRFLSMPWLVWIGTVSYGLYLWHFPVFRVLHAAEFSPAALLALGSLVTFAMAAGSYYFLERYFLRLKRGYHGR